jgi:hypothetical protein
MKIKLAVIVAVLDLVPVLFLVLGLALLWLWQFQKDMEAIAEAAIAAFGPLQKIYDDPGGNIYDSWNLYRFFANRDTDKYGITKYEVLGRCSSACTLVLAVIDKSNICVGPEASFRFHQARDEEPPNTIRVETTEWMVDQMPADIRAWIEKKGGAKNIPADDFWVLGPSEIWAMGYRRCDGTTTEGNQEGGVPIPRRDPRPYSDYQRYIEEYKRTLTATPHDWRGVE